MMIAKTMFITSIATKLNETKQIVTFEELAAKLTEQGFTDHNGQPFKNAKDAAELVDLVYTRLQLQGLATESAYIKRAFM